MQESASDIEILELRAFVFRTRQANVTTIDVIATCINKEVHYCIIILIVGKFSRAVRGLISI